MKGTYRGRDRKLRFKNSGKLVHKWIAKREAKKKYSSSNYIELPYWVKYIFALIFQLILIFYQVPSKEDVQIMMLKTIIPLSESTQPLYPFITLLAIIMQLFTLYSIYDLVMKIYKGIKK
ncbi:MAG: hypothetical protein H6502_05230 [Candidatus Woesearchaeota archaeon]|nr:MAG: hypothetical protein H6502_05230 [Candidatus Woesearchaeota archaeon]